jgi:5-methylcytosine-specific restriction protein A
MVATLKPRIGTATLSRVASMAPRAGLTPRLRGDAGVRRRLRWLSAHPLCVHCLAAGRTTAATVPDHVVPLADGGADDDSNLQSLCAPCHAVKTAAEARARAGA